MIKKGKNSSNISQYKTQTMRQTQTEILELRNTIEQNIKVTERLINLLRQKKEYQN